ncbi:E3 ubiquitin-protein ligase DTX3L isoform X2 [Tachysurus fulvidraco]|uniref:E3 ubiquitin-protein ligase DTX3L isoform X2 n=1 Tax=Tachysurus fulvidraco TaxID=1234273 RepID=UPI001FEE5909|nr:E3 ubiquitin-protein ligase DTX3L isoform X2 [Tachysurus fulvidraco]
MADEPMELETPVDMDVDQSSGGHEALSNDSSDAPTQSSDQNQEDLYRAVPGRSDSVAVAADQISLSKSENSSTVTGGLHQNPQDMGASGLDLYRAVPGRSDSVAVAADQISLSKSENSSTVTGGLHQNPQDMGASGLDLYSDPSASSATSQALNGSDEEAQNPAAVAEVVKQVTADKNEILPSAPRDVAKFSVKVDWSGDLPDKWRKHLQIALQTWCNSDLTGNCSIDVVHLSQDGHNAEVEVTPSSALKDIQTATLTFKQLKKEAKVYFQKGELMPEGKSSTLKENRNVTAAATQETIADAGASSIVQRHKENPGASGAFTVPPFLYIYLIQAYKKEVENIENEFGVKIQAETCISFSAEKSESASNVRRATEAFSELYLSNANKTKSIPIPQAHMESEIMKEVLQNIPNDQTKIMLSMSANNHLLFGPQDIISTVANRLNLDGGDASSFNLNKSHNMKTSSIWNETWKTSQSLDMDIKDIHTQIEMDEVHWQLMEAACKEQISEIQNKYGVAFHAEPVLGSVKVSARSVGTHQFNLEAHALNALTHLYQKVVTSAVTCELKDASHTEVVSQVFKSIQSQGTCVGEGTRNGSWTLFGLPKHLVTAIGEIEKTLGQPVFDEKITKLLRYPWKFPQASQKDQMETDGIGGAYGTGLRGGRDNPDFTQKFPNKTKEDDKKEENDDTCPICLDTFTQKTKLKCGHEFCKDCLRQSIQSSGEICPLCKKIFGKLKGTQPAGHMTWRILKHFPLPGFPYCDTIEIHYNIPNGIQTSDHPNPGQPYHGTNRTAYLPNNAEGNHVLKLLERAFNEKLIFTVGLSTTSGRDNAVIWNDIHHKTNRDGGQQGYGYPDPDYLRRVKEELKAKGIE